MIKHRIKTDLFLKIAVARIGGEQEDCSSANDITVTERATLGSRSY